MLDLVYKILEVHDDVFYIIIVVCVLAAVLKREMLGSDMMAILAAPTYIAASLVTLYLSREHNWVPVGDEQIEAIIASFIGITITFIIFVIGMNTVNAITGWQVKRKINSRNLGARKNQEKPTAG